MMKRILSMLLALLMLASVFPASAFAEDTTATTAATTEATTAPACDTCGNYDCASDHLTWCVICRKDDCGEDHVSAANLEPCDKCGSTDCAGHENWCDRCKTDNCGKEHKPCETCGTVDCTKEHKTCPTCGTLDCAKEHKTCETCGTVDCTKEHKACPTCSAVDCTADHTNWCDKCKKDNCGVEHNVLKKLLGSKSVTKTAEPCAYCEATPNEDGVIEHTAQCNTKFSVDASADVGQTAIFTGQRDYAPYANSKPDETFDYDLYDGDDRYDFQQAEYDYLNPPLVKIVDAHWEVSGPALWYRVEALDGETLPDGITSDSWIFQRNTKSENASDNTLFFVDTSLLGKTVGFKNATVALYSDIYREDSKEVTQEALPVMVVEDIFHDGEKAWYSVNSENWPQEYADYHYVPASAVELVEAPEEPEWDETTPVDLVLSATVDDVTITFEGRMPIRTTLSASAYGIEDPSDFGLENTDNVKAAYDIKLLDGDGNETQPEDAVFLAMDASEMGLEDADVVEIIHKHGSEVTKSTHVVINGMLVFPVEDFSIFVVNHTTETTGVQITGNTPENPYEITVGETKIFFDSYGGGETASYSATFYPMSTIFNVIGVIDFFYLVGGEYQQVTVEREGDNNYNYSFDILLNGEPIPGLTDLGRNVVPPGIYTKSTTTTTYIGEWQVADESNAITYEITSVQKNGNQHVAPYITVTAVDAIDEDESDVVLTYKYVYGGNIYEEEMYLRVVAPQNGLYIDDQVPENGCLVPAGLDPLKAHNATYTWTRSDRRPIQDQALNEDGSINLSIDRGGLTKDLTSLTYTLTVKLLDGSELEAKYDVPYTNEILNSSFETPVLGLDENVGGHKYYMNGYPGLYWKTTAPGNTPSQLTEDIEMIQEGTRPESDYGVSKAADGKQFVELNAENFGALYQDILSTPGATLSWSFSHNGRTTSGSNNTMYVIIAATKDADSVITEADIDGLLDSIPGNANIGSSGTGYRLEHNDGVFYVWKHSADNNSSTWEKISGSYTVPEGQYLTRLFFASETNTGSTQASTLGNLIDAVSAGEYMDYTVRYYKFENNQFNEVATAALSGTDRVYEKISLNKTDGEDLVTFLDQYGLPASILINGRTYPGTVDDLKQGLYLTDYGTKIEGAAADTFKDYDIVLQIYFQIPNITVTKEIVITNWADLTAQQKETLFAEGLTAEFGLYTQENPTATDTPVTRTTVTIIQESSSGKLTAMASFPIDESYYDKDYWIREISAPDIRNYAMETKYSKTKVHVEQDDQTTVEKESVDSVTVTNTYSPRGNLQVKKLVTKAFTDDVELTAEQLSKDFEFKVSISNPKPGAVYTFTKYIQDPNDTMNEAKAANVPLVKTDGNSEDNSNVLTVDQTGHLTFKLKHGEYIIIHNLPSGACTIEETTEDTAYETPVFDKVQYRIPADGGTEEAECTNALKRTTGTLKITKNVDNAAGVTGIVPADGFEFTVTLNEFSGDQIPVKFKRENGETTEQIALTPAEDNQKTFKIKLKHGETAAIENIPATGYYIQETEYDFFETAWNKNSGRSLNSGVIRGGATIDAICTNKYGVNTGDLRITKTVKADSTTDTVPDDTYHIRVDLKEIVLDAGGTETVGEAISNTLGFQYTVYQPGEDGIPQTISTDTVSTGGSISLKKNQYAVIKGIPSCFYEITEMGATSPTVNNYALNEHYDVTYEGKNGRITNGQEAQAKVINTFKRHLAELTIRKSGTSSIDENQSYIFNVRCDNPTFGQAVNMNVVITGDNSVTLSELPIGTYTVTEQSGWSWRYTFQSASGVKVTSATNSPTITVTVDGSENNVIEVTNNRTEIYWLNGAAAKPNVFDGTAN